MDDIRTPCPACGYFHAPISPCWGKLTPNARYNMFPMKTGNPVSMRSYRIFDYVQPYSQLRKQALGPSTNVTVHKVSPMGGLPEAKYIPLLLGVGLIWALGVWAHK